MIPEDPNDELPPNLGLTVGFIASVILSIGYVVDTIGTGIALYEANRDYRTAERAAQDQQQQISDIQNKLDQLLGQMEELKKEQDGSRNRYRHKRG
ncbi:hypothetical protein [Psychrobacillus lasiicapitis]|uniref:Uncharacterized protein n=2 Tax=Psychrobacillus lasiicapitis TaxID=1636719 RepID=A0A544T6R1_9BACI|nr:hypothetical protein [Psychrobacillus lasiicapitis]TQR13121.1 hypothetical protein FG382_11375 [Psychrobacillus lasiicapitis]GGA34300.1 hypothetical protein GCM10011384_25020 [Psychrobacillus lasiicapitis]